MCSYKTRKTFAIFKDVQNIITHFEKIVFEVNALTFFFSQLENSQPEYREDFILPFLHVFEQFLQWDLMQSIK